MLKSCQTIYMAYLWLSKVTVSSAIMNTGHSSHTISSNYRHFRSLVASTLQEEDREIGGQGIIVEVDETKMGKRKYNRGHRVDGVWVIAGVERRAERKMLLIAVENRDSETLNNIIMSHVKEGSIIHTDMWKGYGSITLQLVFNTKLSTTQSTTRTQQRTLIPTTLRDQITVSKPESR